MEPHSRGEGMTWCPFIRCTWLKKLASGLGVGAWGSDSTETPGTLRLPQKIAPRAYGGGPHCYSRPPGSSYLFPGVQELTEGSRLSCFTLGCIQELPFSRMFFLAAKEDF